MTNLGTLFSSREEIKAMLQYMEDIGRLRNNFGNVVPLNLNEMNNNPETVNMDGGDLRWPNNEE